MVCSDDNIVSEYSYVVYDKYSSFYFEIVYRENKLAFALFNRYLFCIGVSYFVILLFYVMWVVVRIMLCSYLTYHVLGLIFV